MSDARRTAYFRANVRLICGLLVVWAFVSFGCGILFAPWLDQFTFPFTKYPLGFWFAQQGSIYVFVILILIYVKAMNRLDARFGVTEEDG
jgi:putative solute:sodium symporter small subunit